MSQIREVVRLKVARAQDHVNWLQAEIDDYRAATGQRHAYSIVEKVESETETRVTIALVREPPIEWAIVIGETLHNLRSALEHIAWYLAGPAGGHDGTGFPIYDAEPGFDAARPGKLRGVPQAAVAAIKRLQPYDSTGPIPGHPLRVLHELNRIEKHRLPQIAANTIGAGVGQPGMGLQLGDTWTITFEHQAMNRAVRRRQPNMRDRLTIDVVFAQPGEASNRPVVATLTKIGQHMERVVLPELDGFLG